MLGLWNGQGEVVMYDKIVVGVDQSYTRTGISIAVDGKLLKVSSLAFRGCRFKSEKRLMLSHTINHIIETNVAKAKELIIICERVRTFSHNASNPRPGEVVKKPDMFISTDYIKATGALIATIVDTAFQYQIPVYSADTRSWKSQIVGSASGPAGTGKKVATINHVMGLGHDVSSVNKKGTVCYDDDAADSACIALYGFIPSTKQKLKLEQ